MPEKDVYVLLMERLRKTWFGLPEAEELMPLLKARYTPEEADILAVMPFSSISLTELVQITKIESSKLHKKMDAMARKGIIFRTEIGEDIRYNLNDAFFTFLRSSFWQGQSDKDTKKLASLINQYYYHGFMEKYSQTHLKGLRVLPIYETIEDKHQILPYEEVCRVLDSVSYYSVSFCPCRQRKKLDPDSPKCKHSTENCLHFDRLGHYIVENGLGREITREETEKILRDAAEEGLIHGVSTWQENVDTIRNCCKCCCMWFEAFHKLKHAESMMPSDFRVRTTAESCKGCGLCVKRCPMEALHLEKSPLAKNETAKIAVLNSELCIGCGICAYKCPTKSLILERRPERIDIPKTSREYASRIAADFETGIIHVRTNGA